MHNFRELKIWQKSRDFVKDAYSYTSKFPDKEKYVLVSQINRSVISISSNIVEGFGRNGSKDFQRFLDIAIGSAFELESQIIIANDLGYINNESLATLTSKVQKIQKMNRGFRHHLEKSNI